MLLSAAIPQSSLYTFSSLLVIALAQAFGAISTWTIYLANSLYVEAKRRKVCLHQTRIILYLLTSPAHCLPAQIQCLRSI